MKIQKMYSITRRKRESTESLKSHISVLINKLRSYELVVDKERERLKAIVGRCSAYPMNNKALGSELARTTTRCCITMDVVSLISLQAPAKD